MARRYGVIGVINRFRRPAQYEAMVHDALVENIRQGDVVWDVGANIGLYTAQFCEWTGEMGFVVAFEPSPESCEQIRSRLKECHWVRVENVALGEFDGAARLAIEGDSVENHLIVGDGNGAGTTVAVFVSRGDTMAEKLGRVPDVIKIDVEGFEEEVLQGMGTILDSVALRCVLVEVHFSKLEKRGRLGAPREIEALLKSKGLRTRWVDPSHLLAVRQS